MLLSEKLALRLRNELGLPVTMIERVRRGKHGKSAGTFAWIAYLDQAAGKGHSVGSEDTMQACVQAGKLEVHCPPWASSNEKVVSAGRAHTSSEVGDNPVGATLTALIALPPSHAYWRNRWMFTRPVVMQESRQGADPEAFRRWIKSQPKSLQAYIENLPTV